MRVKKKKKVYERWNATSSDIGSELATPRGVAAGSRKPPAGDDYLRAYDRHAFRQMGDRLKENMGVVFFFFLHRRRLFLLTWPHSLVIYLSLAMQSSNGRDLQDDSAPIHSVYKGSMNSWRIKRTSFTLRRSKAGSSPPSSKRQYFINIHPSSTGPECFIINQCQGMFW